MATRTIQLPAELQSQVCGNLTKAELKVTRLVCKSFDQAVVPFLFDEVFVAASHSDLKIADLVVSRFGVYIKTITLSCVHYKSLSMEDFRSMIISKRINPHTLNLERVNGHLRHAFEVYCMLQTKHLEIHKSRVLLPRLCLILSRSPNVRRMILTDYGNNRIYDQSRVYPHDPWKLEDLCSFKLCKQSVSDHLSFHVRPDPPYSRWPDPFDLAMLAISEAKSNIKEFAIIHHGHGERVAGTFLSKYFFAMTASKSDNLRLQLQRLTKLRLRLADGGDKSQAQSSCYDRVVARALSHAVNLRSLFIEGDTPELPSGLGPDTLTTMSDFLGGCRFPNLRSLLLNRMDSREEESLDSLKSSPCLKHLTLERFRLHESSWEILVEKIRSAVRLESVMLHEVAGGFSDIKRYKYSMNHHSIERFFFYNGENPFTEEAIRVWHEIDNSTRWEINRDQRSEIRYQMLH